MSVRAKFRVDSVLATASNGHTVCLSPVTTGSEENKQFYKYTPFGKIELATINLDAAVYFVPGKEYYIDFILAE